MAGPTPCLPTPLDSPVELRTEGNELRTRLIVDSRGDSSPRPASYPPVAGTTMAGGNPLRTHADGLWGMPYPQTVHRLVRVASIANYVNFPFTDGVTFPDFGTSIAATISNPYPYALKIQALYSFTIYFAHNGGQNAGGTLAIRHITSGITGVVGGGGTLAMRANKTNGGTLHYMNEVFHNHPVQGEIAAFSTGTIRMHLDISGTNAVAAADVSIDRGTLAVTGGH